MGCYAGGLAVSQTCVCMDNGPKEVIFTSVK